MKIFKNKTVILSEQEVGSIIENHFLNQGHKNVKVYFHDDNGFMYDTLSAKIILNNFDESHLDLYDPQKGVEVD